MQKSPATKLHENSGDTFRQSCGAGRSLMRQVLFWLSIVLGAAATRASESLLIGVIGDYGSTAPGEVNVARMLNGWEPDFIMTVGDNNYPDGAADTIDANIGQFFHDYIYPYQGIYGQGAISNRFFPVLGNHDAPNLPVYLAYFALPGNERYYNYRQGPVEIFALNSESDPDGVRSDSVQAHWLQSQLAASTAPWKLVYFHQPPYSSGATYGSVTYMQWPFAPWGATAVLSGHEHLYERVLTNGIAYFVNGLGGGQGIYPFAPEPIAGSQVRYNTYFGAMRIEATETNIVFEFVDRLNNVVDTYRIPPAPPGVPFFTLYPASQTVRPRTNITFRAEAGGDIPLIYQWQFNGSSVPDATNTVLALTNI